MSLRRTGETKRRHQNERGIALLLVLLVTTLLIALIFEFFYGTRVSLREAVNFRDGQRAYYLAWSGVNFAGKLLADNLKNGKPQDNLEQREWQVVPIVSTGDAELRVNWEDEDGKINVASLSAGQSSLARLERLFGMQQIDLDVLDRLKELKVVRLLDELHQVMSDEEFSKIRKFVTVYGADKVDINTAPSEVLQSLGLSESVASLIIDRRSREPFDAREKINAFPGMDTTTAAMLDISSNVFLVHSYATVGGYTKQAEAVIRRDSSAFTILYWKIL